MITSRNYPTELINKFTNEKIFEELTLKGLTDFDALLYWREADLSGDENILLQIFNRVNNYALFIEIFTGEIKNYRRAPGELKKWLNDNPDFDPFKNTKFELALDKILKVTISQLTVLQRQIVNVVAALVIPTSFGFLEKIIQESGTGRISLEQIDLALTSLETRGLLGWDKKTNQYEMHPVVRGFIWVNLNADEKRVIYRSIFSQFRNITFEQNEELIISRDKELEYARNWLIHSKKRSFTVTGPPASGKSTFLKFLMKDFSKLPNTICLFFDVNDFTDHQGRFDPGKIKEWIVSTNLELQVSILGYQRFNVRADTKLPKSLSSFGEHLDEQLLGRNIVLIIDGGNHLFHDDNEDEWQKLERIFIGSFLNSDSIRFIIGLHDRQRIQTPYLRRSTENIELQNLDIPEVQEQVEKVILKSADLPFNAADLLGILPGYNWAHPGLNMLLYILVSDIFSDQSTYDAPSLLFDLFDALGYLPDHNKEEVINWLLKITEMNFEVWSPNGLSETLEISTAQAWEVTNILQSTMLIVGVDGGFKLADGINEFIRSVKKADTTSHAR